MAALARVVAALNSNLDATVPKAKIVVPHGGDGGVPIVEFFYEREGTGGRLNPLPVLLQEVLAMTERVRATEETIGTSAFLSNCLIRGGRVRGRKGVETSLGKISIRGMMGDN